MFCHDKLGASEYHESDRRVSRFHRSDWTAYSHSVYEQQGLEIVPKTKKSLLDPTVNEEVKVRKWPSAWTSWCKLTIVGFLFFLLRKAKRNQRFAIVQSADLLRIGILDSTRNRPQRLGGQKLHVSIIGIYCRSHCFLFLSNLLPSLHSQAEWRHECEDCWLWHGTTFGTIWLLQAKSFVVIASKMDGSRESAGKTVFWEKWYCTN